MGEIKQVGIMREIIGDDIKDNDYMHLLTSIGFESVHFSKGVCPSTRLSKLTVITYGGNWNVSSDSGIGVKMHRLVDDPHHAMLILPKLISLGFTSVDYSELDGSTLGLHDAYEISVKTSRWRPMNIISYDPFMNIDNPEFDMSMLSNLVNNQNKHPRTWTVIGMSQDI